MSRLDDELKLALGRMEPSPDFTDRVLKAINPSPAPEKSWWQSLTGAFQLPRVRWVAAAAAASLLIVILAFQYWQPRPIEQVKEIANAGTQPPAESVDNGVAKNPTQPPLSNITANNTGGSKVEDTPRNIRNNNGPKRRPVKRARSAKEIAAEAEGQAAKEQLLLALRIASTTLSEAQRVIRGDDEQPRPEPATRR
ncbi:MAG: hypothetical protein L0229_17085 [Blastocatellia bacterium]|nr:hypothetical protein [Blastocatellia bacterium]